MASLNQNNSSKGNKKPLDQNNSKKPKVRDTPDSRKNEEYDFKGDDITHNKKETRKVK